VWCLLGRHLRKVSWPLGGTVFEELEVVADAFTPRPFALFANRGRPIASNIAKLPVLLGHARPDDSLQAESNLLDERHEVEDTTPE